MERLEFGEATLKYQGQWIVLVNVGYNESNLLYYGDCYQVTKDEDEAYALAGDLRAKGELGAVAVLEGYDPDVVYIGGLE